MPRIRTVKPEFWTDPVMVQLPPLARLFYIGTWNFAICDNGHLEDDPMRLKLQILPAENVDVADLVDALVDAGRLARLEVDGERFLHIRNLAEHQKVDGRWTPRCPVCSHQASPKLTDTPRDSPKNAETHRSKGREGKGKERKGEVGADAPPPRPDVLELCLLLADLVEGNGSKRPNITKSWTDPARLLLDTDKRDPEQAKNLIRWSQANDFWIPNIRSMSKFREKYDTLRLQAERDGGVTNVTRLDPDRPRLNGLAFVPTCPTCGAPPEDVHDPECPDQQWRPNTEGIGGL